MSDENTTAAPEQAAPQIDVKEYETLKERLAKLEKNNSDLLAEKKAAKDAAEAAKLEAAKKGGDVEALEKSWQEKLNAMAAEREAEVGQYKQMVTSLTVGATAATVAAEVFGEHADLMMHHINSRMTTEIKDGKPTVRILDASGKPSAMSIDELKAEFRNNAKFAAFVVGSRASGGGHHGAGKSAPGTMTRSAFDQLSPTQKREFSVGGGKLIDG